MNVLIYGEKACGKTYNAEKLKLKFKCDKVIDGVSYHHGKFICDSPTDVIPSQDSNTLILTNMEIGPVTKLHSNIGGLLLNYKDAKDLL